MPLIFLGASIAGLLLAVRIMFFGAERRHRAHGDGGPLRWAEPAITNFLIMCGIAGYLLTRHHAVDSLAALGIALVLGALWAAIASRFAIAVARIQHATCCRGTSLSSRRPFRRAARDSSVMTKGIAAAPCGLARSMGRRSSKERRCASSASKTTSPMWSDGRWSKRGSDFHSGPVARKTRVAKGGSRGSAV
jgi:hypothetical protein